MLLMTVSWDSLISSDSVCLVIVCEVTKRRVSVLPFFKFRTSLFLSSQSAKQSMSFANLALMDRISWYAAHKTVSSAYFKILE